MDTAHDKLTTQKTNAAWLKYTANVHDAFAAEAKRKLRALPSQYHPFRPMRLEKTAETRRATATASAPAQPHNPPSPTHPPSPASSSPGLRR